MIITEDGGNISIGERQLICITRAILRKSKIVVMDEATASIDVNTENIIQKAIKNLLFDSTILTIAHRIKTVLNSDRILVLEQGEVKEFDSPKTLLQNKNSLFSMNSIIMLVKLKIKIKIINLNMISKRGACSIA